MFHSIFFDMSEFGEIQNIYYDQSEDLSVLSAKKAILDILSSKLVISQSQVEKGQRWGYGSNETGHAGIGITILYTLHKIKKFHSKNIYIFEQFPLF